jgi:hypothetical protein
MPRAPRGPKLRKVVWSKAWRIIASRYPPIAVFERLAVDAAAQQALIDLEQLTNPRLRDEIGDISLVPPARRVSGPGASYVMASFTHLNPKGSRFSDGSYGVYYCAENLETAIAETVYHFEAFARDSRDHERYEDMRVLVGSVHQDLHDVVTVSQQRKRQIMDPSSYAHSQPFGAQLKATGSDGIVYPSVRRSGGECAAIFWPDSVGIPKQERHLQYYWNGARVDRYFDYQKESWIAL